MVSIDDLEEVGALWHLPKSAPYINPLTYLHKVFKEPIIGPLKSKMADIRHLENRHDVIFLCWGWSDLDKIAVTFHIAGCSHLAKLMSWSCHIAECNNSIRHIENRLFFFALIFFWFFKCSLGFDERRLSCRLRYTCFIARQHCCADARYWYRNSVRLSVRPSFRLFFCYISVSYRNGLAQAYHHRPTVFSMW